MIGQIISHYKILAKLPPAPGQVGEGGMSSLRKDHKKLTPRSGRDHQ